MRIRDINEEFNKLLEMSVSKKDYPDINLKPEKLEEALRKLAQKLPKWVTRDGNLESWQSTSNSVYCQSTKIKFELKSQGILHVSYNTTVDEFLPRYMEKYKTSSGDYKINYNLHNENLNKVMSDTLGNVKTIITEVKKNYKSFDKAETNTNKLLSKITGILSKVTEDSRTKKLPEKPKNIYRTVLIKPVSIKNGKIVGLGIDYNNTIMGYKEGSSNWSPIMSIISDNYEAMEVLPKILSNLEMATEGKIGTNGLKKEQNKLERERLKQEKINKEKKNLAYSVLRDIKSEMRSLSYYDDYGRGIEENGNSYEFEVRDWGDWGTSREWENDYDWMELHKGWCKKLDKIINKYDKKYKKKGLSFSWNTGEKRWIYVSVSW